MKRSLVILFTMLSCSNFILSDPINRFCGFYGGANINFGPVIFQSVSNSNNQAIFTSSINTPVPLTATLTNNTCEVTYQVLDTLGGGLTVGYHRNFNCRWIIGAEFNGLFYGDLRCTTMISDSNNDITFTNGTITTDLSAKLDRQRCFENKIRLDGVVKLGLLITPISMIYLIGGGSGIKISENESINLNLDARSATSSASNNLANFNEPQKTSCCSWLGGGTVGIGLKIGFSDCLDVFIESRYSKYKTWFRLQQDTVSNASSTTTETDVFTNNFNIAHHIEAYTSLIGINWNF